MDGKNSPELLKSAQTCSELAALTPSQQRAITALLESRSVAAAARQANVGQSTLRRWLREDENFQTVLRHLREEALGHASLRLQQSASIAVDTLYNLLASKNPIEPGRASLVRAALDFAFRSGAYCDLADRIAALENGAAPGENDEADQGAHVEFSKGKDPWEQDPAPKEAA